MLDLKENSANLQGQIWKVSQNSKWASETFANNAYLAEFETVQEGLTSRGGGMNLEGSGLQGGGCHNITGYNKGKHCIWNFVPQQFFLRIF